MIITALKRIVVLAIAALLGAVGALLLNLIVIEKIVIPDPCYYHSHDTSKLFDLFYEMNVYEGCHPIPTRFNFIFTLIVGVVVGITIANFFLKKHIAISKS